METPLIPTFWQPELGSFGTMVQGLDDLHQCLVILLTTPKGADPHRPDFGVDLLAYQDRPLDEARPGLIQDVLEAIRKWERRVKPTAIQVDQTDLGTLRLRLRWVPSGEGNASTGAQALTTLAVTPTRDLLSVQPLAALPWVPFSAQLDITGIDGDTFGDSAGGGA